MYYSTLEKKLKMLSDDNLDEIAKYVEFLLYKKNHTETMTHPDVSEFFGRINVTEDPLKLQRKLRDEWN